MVDHPDVPVLATRLLPPVPPADVRAAAGGNHLAAGGRVPWWQPVVDVCFEPSAVAAVVRTTPRWFGASVVAVAFSLAHTFALYRPDRTPVKLTLTCLAAWIGVCTHAALLALAARVSYGARECPAGGARVWAAAVHASVVYYAVAAVAAVVAAACGVAAVARRAGPGLSAAYVGVPADIVARHLASAADLSRLAELLVLAVVLGGMLPSDDSIPRRRARLMLVWLLYVGASTAVKLAVR